MPKSAKPSIDYQALQTELDNVMSELKREDLDVDTALKHYQRGLELAERLQKYLETAENKVTELKARFNNASK